MKRLAVMMLLIISLAGVGPAQPARPSSDEDELAAAAGDFFRTWLLARNIEEAMKFVSANPILGSCMTPGRLDKKKILSRADVLGVLREVLTHTLTRTPEAKSLSQLVDSSGGIPEEDGNVIFARHRMEEYFQIFRLKPVEDPTDIAYICKFDERRPFREAVARPDVYYLIAKVKGKDSCEPINFELLWVKEHGSWRILTISVLED